MNKQVMLLAMLVLGSWGAISYTNDKPDSNSNQSTYQKYAENIEKARELVAQHGTKILFFSSVARGLLVPHDSSMTVKVITGLPLLATAWSYLGLKTFPEAWEKGLFWGSGTFVWDALIKLPFTHMLGEVAGAIVRTKSLGAPAASTPQ